MSTRVSTQPDLPDADSGHEIPGVLRRSGATCHDLAAATEWLQDQLGSMVGAGLIQPCREMTIALQELDRISQVIRGLGDLHIELGNHTDGSFAPRGRLAAAVRLESLAARILDDYCPGEIDDEFWG
jgi:hypothetical protein